MQFHIFLSSCSMSRRLLELEPSTPTRAIATVSTPSPMTRRYNSSTLYAFLFLMSTVLICFYIHLQPQKDTRTWRHHRASCFSNHISGCYWEGKDKKIEGCQVQKILECAEKTWRQYFGALYLKLCYFLLLHLLEKCGWNMWCTCCQMWPKPCHFVLLNLTLKYRWTMYFLLLDMLPLRLIDLFAGVFLSRFICLVTCLRWNCYYMSHSVFQQRDMYL